MSSRAAIKTPETTGPTRAARLSDVARRVGVSTVAVSKVLNGSLANTRVSDDTRQRILTAAEELRYSPNAVARSLRRQRTDIIGLYLGHGYTDARNPFFAEIVTGLQEGCEAHRLDLLLHSTYRGVRNADAIYAELANGTIDGLVLYAPAADALAARLAASPLPVVAVADAVAGVPSIVVDDAEGGRLVAAHLAERGHRRVAFRVTRNTLVSALRREEAFRVEAARQGIEVVGVLPEHEGHEDADARCQYLDSLRAHAVTAVACANDYTAWHLLAAALRLGLSVPGDIAIAGFDGIAPTTAVLGPRLTTVRAPWVAVARAAVDHLVARIGGVGPSGPAAAETILPVELVTGETT
jgi:DNA-binding LacI/PurR family transcriptional regulator